MDAGESSYRRYLDGDKAAFASVVEQYRAGLIRFVNSYVHNVHTAEDIAIDCFAYLLVHPRRYRFTSPLKSYLYVLGRSRAIDWLRRAKRAETVPLESAENELSDDVSPETAAEESAPEAGQQTPETDPQAEQIKTLEDKLMETTDQLMRTLAEYDNYRKRLQKEKDARYNDGKTDAIIRLLPVADNLERTMAADGDAESYKKGVEMTLKQLADSLAALGAEAFGEVGDTFDPNLHNGVMHEDNDELAENTITAVFMKGYRIGDRVIRHAAVKVAN